MRFCSRIRNCLKRKLILILIPGVENYPTSENYKKTIRIAVMVN
jgi:hypothetical protein